MEQPLKVLVTSNSSPPDFIGGAELVAHRHAQLVQELGMEVEFFAGDCSGTRPLFSVEAEDYDGLRLHRVMIGPEECDYRRTNFLNPGVRDVFARVMDGFQPDVVHLHNTMGLSLAMLHEAKRRGAVTVHDHWGFCLRNTLLRWDQALCFDYSRCEECLPYVMDRAGRRIPVSCRRDYMAHLIDEVDLLISPSRYLGARYAAAGFPSERITQIEYGVDLRRFGQLRRTPSSVTRFSFIGYLGEHKGLVLLLNALDKLPPESAWQLNLVGAGHLEAYVQSWCDSHHLADRVNFWGKVDAKDVEAVYQQTDVLVLPSIWPENQPVTILEAMTNGLPVIASCLGGNPEIVEDGVTGWTFEPEEPDDLARCMTECMHDPVLRQERGAAGLRRVMAFPYRHQVEMLAAAYRQLAGALTETGRSRRPVIGLAGPGDGSELTAIGAVLPGHLVLPLDWLEEDERPSLATVIVLPGSECQLLVSILRLQQVPIVMIGCGDPAYLASSGGHPYVVAGSTNDDAVSVLCGLSRENEQVDIYP